MVGQYDSCGAVRLIDKDIDSVHGAAPQQVETLNVHSPPQPGTVSALGANAPGPAVRAAEPTSKPSMELPQEPPFGTVAPLPSMS